MLFRNLGVLLLHNIAFVCRVLASFNLPAAIEDVCNQDVMPESVRDKSSRVRNAGGIDALEKMRNDLPGLLKRNREILDEVRSRLYFSLCLTAFCTQ